MINKRWKKLLSVLLSVAMLLSLLPSFSLTAFADQVKCPNCGSTDLDNYGGNSYFCNACGNDFTLPGPPCPNCQSTNTTQISADRYFCFNCDEDFQYVDPNDTVEGDGTQNNPYLVGSLASFQRVCSQWYEDDPVYIKLKDDITFGTATFFISCNVNLDLDNYDIGEDQTTRFGISEDNTLNVTGATGCIYSLEVNYGATVILTSGTIENIDLDDGSKFVMNGGCVSDEIECNEDTTTTINGGTVEEIFTNFNAAVVINNVTITGNLLINGESTVTIYDGAIRDLKLDDECRCTVNGGSFTQSSSVVEGGTLEVTGGNFSGPWGGILNNGGNVVISGGNFGCMLNNSGTTALSGGNFEKTNDYGDDEQGYLENLTAPGFMVIEGNTYFTVVPSHTITWKKDENTVIDTTEVEVGKTPAHADPEGYEDADYTYTFAGWTPSIVAATADATYTATFTATPKTPAPAAVTFTKVTDASQITAENIGTCTAEDAKAWALANWDVAHSDDSMSYLAFYTSGGTLNYVLVYSNMDEDSFSSNVEVYSGVLISDLQNYVSYYDENVCICTPSAAPAHVHSLTPHDATNAGCTTAGNSAYWSCSCGMYFSDENGATEIAENSWVIPALGHNYDNVEYSSDETRHWKVCSRCYEESPFENHTWGSTLYVWGDNNSTVTASHGCTVCGKQVSETVDTTSVVTAAATCTTKELSTFTATFTKPGFTVQTREGVETAPATGHDFSYAGLNDTIIATCSHNGCEYHSNGAFIVIHAPALTVYGGAESAAATLEGLDAFNAATGLSVSENAIRYYNTKIEGMEILKDGLPILSPAGAGTYWAEIKIQNATAYVVYTIAKIGSSAASVAANEWTFDETTKPLLTVTGEAAGGTMKYALGTATQPGTFGDTIPEASAADTYYVWYMVAGDANHNDTDAVPVTVTVAKANSTAATVAANEWTFDGTAHALLTVTGEAVGGTMKYALGTATQPGTFGDAIPEATDHDTYYVWYMVAGDTNHNDTDAVLVTVTVANDEALDAVIAAIDAIGPVTEVTDTIKANIKTARDGYDALTPAQQALVTNYATLVDAEAAFAALFVFADETEISISGVERYGETLTATATDVPAFITDAVVRWYNDNNELLGTGETYTLTAADIGFGIRAELYSAEANDSVWSDFTAIVGKGIIKNYTLPTAAHIMYPQTLAEATLTGGDTGDIEGVWAWVIPDAQPTSAQSGSSFELTFTPAGTYADLYEGITTRLAVIVDPAPFEPQTIEDPASGLTFDAEFAQNVEIELTDITYTQSAYLALLRAAKKDDSGLVKFVLMKTIVFTIDGEEADEAYSGTVNVISYVGEKFAGSDYSVWFFIDGAPVNYVGHVGYDGVLVIENVVL